MMGKFKIAGHVFDGHPSFVPLNHERGIGVVVPSDTPKEVIMELQDASVMEILDDETEETIGSYRLLEWRKLEHVYSNYHTGIALVWLTVNPDLVALLQEKIEELEEKNQHLLQENTDLEMGLLELASIVGENETPEE